jgi:hypothetical protein
MFQDPLSVFPGAASMSPETLTWLKTLAMVSSIAIGTIVCAGILTILLERFLGAKGRIVGLFGLFIPNTPIGKSMLKLREWHNPEKREALFKAYGKNHERDLMEKHPFSQWMVAEMVRNYENNVQGIAYLGAAVLIFVIGLRGIQVLTKDDSVVIILALLLEFTLIGVLGLMLFYKPEDDKHGGVDIGFLTEMEKLKGEVAEKDTLIRVLRADVDQQAVKVDTMTQQLEDVADRLRGISTGTKGKGSV